MMIALPGRIGFKFRADYACLGAFMRKEKMAWIPWRQDKCLLLDRPLLDRAPPLGPAALSLHPIILFISPVRAQKRWTDAGAP